MHLKPIHYILFVILMGPLVLFSQNVMHWGPTGTFACVIVSVVLGFVIIVSSKRVSRRLRRSLGSNRAATADFLFGPTTHPNARKRELHQAHQQVMAHERTSVWRAPTMQQQTQPRLPDPQRRPAQFSYPQYAQAASKTLAQAQSRPPVTSAVHPDALRRPAPPTSRGRLTLGPDAAMPLETASTSGIIIDSPRRPAAPIYVEEWIRLGLGILIIDLYNQYAPFLTRMPPGFGFLAGSGEIQDSLTQEQQARYMAVSGTHEAIQIGKGIVAEGLQIIFNFASFQSTTEAGTLLLALLKGFWDKISTTAGKPCAILITDPRPLFPADEAECLISTKGVAQSVYDLLMTMLETTQNAPGRKMAMYLSTPTLASLEEETLATCRLWIVNTYAEAEIDQVEHYLELNDEDRAALDDGETLIWDTGNTEADPVSVRFRRSAITLRAPTALPRRQESAEERERLGEQAGLGTKQDA